MKLKYPTNKVKRKMRRMARRRAERGRIALWHRKFAWRPLKITVPKDSTDHSTVIWFEWVMQKAHIKNYEYRSIRKFIWTRYPEKEYFKKKLDGTLEPEEQFINLSHDGTDMSMTVQGSGAAGASKGSPIKKGGPYISGNKLGGPTGSLK